MKIMNSFKRYVAVAAVALAFAGLSNVAVHAEETTDDDFDPVLVTVTADTPLFYEPDAQIPTDDHLAAGQTWYVVGVDATGKYARVYITDTFSTWVPVASLALDDVSSLPVISE
jgi:hypothetical protein